ncbi:indole-3-glycerol phosphate synthase [Butyrivibrio fibrisolvens DSM 3071]|uniref:Indole-3-glycerol phosphate synthase n=1 Tax=Butyrivibrio fibrisolvens DSM 3071 TaxID=1121131 RepID=A0A1M6C4D8_BUTFI|nr:indole-3-glycerol phosphate synthase TrpC [Butyrivibrio fibrisolvens]SHI55887.1 indole-3-glycerol phosphate synthase [Butyrivibrio fibrisolvens DSM 3071]
MILDDLVAATSKRLEVEKSQISPEKMKEMALEIRERELKDTAGDASKDKDFIFKRNLQGPGIHFICEVKKASPSKGIIAEDFPYIDIAKEYEKIGADAISVLTEPDYFKGNIEYIKDILDAGVTTPLLRKDFTIDEYMIYQAKVYGASAILLICAILDDERLKAYHELATSLGLSAIVETHDEDEVKRALAIGAEIVGVNNRNLKDFTVDLGNSIRLRKLVPQDKIFVAESGIKTEEDMIKLRDAGVNAVLIGETFMRSDDKGGMIQRLKRGI